VVTQLDPFAIRPAHGTVYALDPTEKFGKSTRAILGELGYGTDEIDRMIAKGAVSESWSREYLPS
jgi:crotonobetainyl-CoA:carnitine CoA-transferase CaiB-like acyl-CoA transferase